LGPPVELIDRFDELWHIVIRERQRRWSPQQRLDRLMTRFARRDQRQRILCDDKFGATLAQLFAQFGHIRNRKPR
jgi:hypothetical protein